MRTTRRRGAIATVLIAVPLLLGGCGADSPDRAGAARSNPPATPAADIAPTPAPDHRRGESVPAYCRRLERGSAALDKLEIGVRMPAEDKATLQRTVDALVGNAPPEIRPAIRVIGRTLIETTKPQARKSTSVRGATERAREFAAAVGQFSAWVHKNCPGYRIDVETP